MRKAKVWRNILLAGGACAAVGAGKLFCDVIVRGKKEETKEETEVHGEERAQLLKESMQWLDERGSEKVSIQSFDGLTLKGEFFEGNGMPDSTVLLVHGYRSSRRKEFAAIARFYLEAGYHVLMVDNRAHGESEGKYIGFGCLDREDCYRWVRFLDERFEGKQKIFLHGISMGASTVLMTSNLNLPESVRGIVADCGYTSPREQFIHVLKSGRKRYAAGLLVGAADLICRRAAGYGFSDCSAKECVADTKIPVLIIHGDQDSFVPTQMGREIYDACASSKELYLAEGAGHAESYYLHREDYEQKVLSFFRRCAEGDLYED